MSERFDGHRRPPIRTGLRTGEREHYFWKGINTEKSDRALAARREAADKREMAQTTRSFVGFVGTFVVAGFLVWHGTKLLEINPFTDSEKQTAEAPALEPVGTRPAPVDSGPVSRNLAPESLSKEKAPELTAAGEAGKKGFEQIEKERAALDGNGNNGATLTFP